MPNKSLEQDNTGTDRPAIDAATLRREWELSDRWSQRTEPLAPTTHYDFRPRASMSKLGLATISLSVEEIDAVLDRLEGTNGCADPALCDAVAILAGARARASVREVVAVPPAQWGVR